MTRLENWNHECVKEEQAFDDGAASFEKAISSVRGAGTDHSRRPTFIVRFAKIAQCKIDASLGIFVGRYRTTMYGNSIYEAPSVDCLIARDGAHQTLKINTHSLTAHGGREEKGRLWPRFPHTADVDDRRRKFTTSGGYLPESLPDDTRGRAA